MTSPTSSQYDEAIEFCHRLFIDKNKDYGSAWRILRTPSLTDQIFIKAQRIRTIEDMGNQKINEPADHEFIGIVNYSIMALIQLKLGSQLEHNSSFAELDALYRQKAAEAKKLMMAKNHDYGEAWRDMRVSSFTDLILMKLLRIKQIENHDGQTLVSEGMDANYLDILNYAVFALITIKEEHEANNKL